MNIPFSKPLIDKDVVSRLTIVYQIPVGTTKVLRQEN